MRRKGKPWLVMVGVPVDCACAEGPSARPFGAELAPVRLRSAGPSTVGAADGGDLAVRLVGRSRDAGTGVLGWRSVLHTTAVVRGQVRELSAGGAVPLLAGLLEA